MPNRDRRLFAKYLDDKKAGPLVCPICNRTDTFEPAVVLGPPPETQLFRYASCSNCGYSIFFAVTTTNVPERDDELEL
jgi:DNA-directed RNA polymerase subunit RPC12/RpoP